VVFAERWGHQRCRLEPNTGELVEEPVEEEFARLMAVSARSSAVRVPLPCALHLAGPCCLNKSAMCFEGSARMYNQVTMPFTMLCDRMADVQRKEENRIAQPQEGKKGACHSEGGAGKG
jgi:hypothetical protein